MEFEISSKSPVSIILPVRNEVNIIEDVIYQLHTNIVSKIPHSEIIIVDEGSTDGTKEVLLNLQNSLSSIQLLIQANPIGYTEAIRNATAIAKHDMLYFCDAGGKHDPDDFWKMYQLIKDYDLIIGVKDKREDMYPRVLLSKIFNRYMNFYFKTNFADINCPMRLVRSRVFKPLLDQKWILSELIHSELTLRMLSMGVKINEISIKHSRRTNNASNLLPFKKMPQVIVKTIFSIRQLKRSLQSLERQQ